MSLIFQIVAAIIILSVVGGIGAALIPRALHWGQNPKARKNVEPNRPFDPHWGNLPVVKVTGSRGEGRFVETRRINVGESNFEVRLHIRGDVVETHRFVKISEAVSCHDDLCQRNGVNPNEGAAPAWYSLGRERAKRHAELPPGEDLDEDYRVALSQGKPERANGDAILDPEDQ